MLQVVERVQLRNEAGPDMGFKYVLGGRLVAEAIPRMSMLMLW